MKIALAQLNPLIGDIKGNTDKIIQYAQKASDNGADLIVFPELTIPGYPPRDLLEKQHFVENNVIALEQIKECVSIPAVIGFVKFNQEGEGKKFYNAAAYINDGEIIALHQKILLPTYDVFDENRYFDSDTRIGTFRLKGKLFALTICEDLWNDTLPMKRKIYRINPVDELLKLKPDYVINIAASPYGVQKKELRENMLTSISQKISAPIIYVNQIGGQDELVFDGHSFVANQEGVVFALSGFQEEIKIYDTEKTEKSYTGYSCDEEELFYALVLGLKDYVTKCRFQSVVFGLSGGIDSALTAVIAKEALGAENVTGILMPSHFSSSHSVDDAVALAKNLGINYHIIPIKNIYNDYLKELEIPFKELKFNVAEENIQARIRGNLVMAFSNKFGMLPLATGNKSEISCGYCTLYGDMCGGLCVIGDVYKTDVYKLSRYINREKEIIPESTMIKPPSAELRPDQKDSDSLPEYDILDEILKMYIEDWASAGEIIKSGFDEKIVQKVVRLVDVNEYKRRQAAPVLKVSLKSFGTGRRMPIAQGWTEKGTENT